MKHRLLTFCAALLLFAPSLRAQEINLFNGESLAGWNGLMQFWSVRDGAITGEIVAGKAPAKNTFLTWQGGHLADFEFSCKYKIVSHKPKGPANTGVQFRARYAGPQGYELIGYQGEMGRTFNREGVNLNGCLTEDPPGAVIAQSSANAANSYRMNDWNEYRIVAAGKRIQIFVNGLPAVDTTDDRYSKGLLGLQLHKGSGPYVIQFKELKLKGLNAGEVASGKTAPAPEATATDPNQPLVETLSQQAPNAGAWVLAPLDQTVPPDIRQNLTFLLEDLLDEAKSKPVAGPAAYKTGEQLCRFMIAALDERKQALAAAGFRAVEAQARTGVTSQALEARRNYKMSWPQYAREESQRAELKNQAVSNAEVMKERPKLEWTQRTAAMQKQLDALYSSFRDALRQGAPAK